MKGAEEAGEEAEWLPNTGALGGAVCTEVGSVTAKTTPGQLSTVMRPFVGYFGSCGINLWSPETKKAV